MNPESTQPVQRTTSAKRLDSVTEKLAQRGTVTVTGDKMTFVVDNLAESVKKSIKLQPNDASQSTSRRTSDCGSLTGSALSEIRAINSHVLESLEIQTSQLSASLDKLIDSLTKRMHEASAITVGYSQTYCDAINEMGNETDEAVKCMYMLIAHCEELDRAMEPVHKVSAKIKHIKTVLSALEAQIT